MTRLLVTADAAWPGPSQPPRLTGPFAVLVEDGFVAWAGHAGAAPDDAPRLDVDGVLLPGLVDHHVHTGLVETGALLRAGLTTVRDLGWIPSEILAKADASVPGSSAGPRILAAGPFLTAPGGYPTRQDWAPDGIAWELEGPEDAVEAVTALARHRPDTVKVALNTAAGPCPDDATLAALVETAHAFALPVTAHTEGEGQAERAATAGVDRLAHTPFSEHLDGDLLDRLAAHTGIVSTIDIHGWGEDTPQRRVAVDNLRRFRERGGTVLYGTDLGNGPLPQGVNPREIAELGRAGMSPAEIAESMLHEELRAGARADLVAVPADPLADPQRLARAVPVLKAGVPVGDRHSIEKENS